MTDYARQQTGLGNKIQRVIDRESKNELLRLSPLSDRAMAEHLRIKFGIEADIKTIWTYRVANGLPNAARRRMDYLKETQKKRKK